MSNLKIYSIFSSLQGESTFCGLPTVFVRLAGCNLGCVYCDTLEAQDSNGEVKSISKIIEEVKGFSIDTVEVTGGEPLAQENSLELLKGLCDEGFKVLIETSGAYPIKDIDKRVRIIMDIKTPGSGAENRFLKENLSEIMSYEGEIKFVITDKRDFEFATKIAVTEKLSGKIELLISPLSNLSLKEVAKWIMESGIRFRLQLQLHKIIWPNSTTEV